MEGCRGERSWGKGSFDMVVGVNQPVHSQQMFELNIVMSCIDIVSSDIASTP